MDEFLISSLEHAWPYYVMAFVVAELLLIIKERVGVIFELVSAIAICVFLTWAAQYQNHNSWALQNKPGLLAMVNFLSIFMPLAVFVLANHFLVLIQKTGLKHLTLLGVVIVTTFVWPIWALVVVCSSGLDCL